MKNLTKYSLYIVGAFIAILALWFVVDFNRNVVRGVTQAIENKQVKENYLNK